MYRRTLFALFLISILIVAGSNGLANAQAGILNWKLVFDPAEYGFTEINWDNWPPGGGYITHMGVFKDNLYAFVSSINGAQIYRTSDGKTWQAVTQPGLGTDEWISWDMTTFRNQLYVPVFSLVWEEGIILRSADGLNWETVSSTLEGSPIRNPDKVGVFQGMIYVTVFQYPIWAEHGAAQLWRSPTGNPGTWQLVREFGTFTWHTNGLDTYQGKMYMSVQDDNENITIWRTGDGVNWEEVVEDGFQSLLPSTDLKNGGEFMIHNGLLYFSNGPDVYRTNNGVNWTLVEAGGFGDVNNTVQSLYSYLGDLYAFTSNFVSGVEVWRSHTGNNGTWSKVNTGGWGDIVHNQYTYQGDQVMFNDDLYVGTDSDLWFGNIWKLVHP